MLKNPQLIPYIWQYPTGLNQMTLELTEETVRKRWVLTDNLHLPGVSFLEAWAHSHPAALRGPYTQTRHSPRCAGSGREGHSTTTSQGWPQGGGQQMLVLRTRLQLQALGRVEGPVPVFPGTADARGGAPSSSQDTPSMGPGRELWWYLQKMCQRPESSRSLITMAIFAGEEHASAFRMIFSREESDKQTKRTLSPQTPRCRPVNPRDLLVTQTCYSLFVPSWKATPTFSPMESLPKCQFLLTSTSAPHFVSCPISP